MALGNLISIIIFAIFCLILICVFIVLIVERICPLLCLRCSPSYHHGCSSQIHRWSDSDPVSRKQLLLRISLQRCQSQSPSPMSISEHEPVASPTSPNDTNCKQIVHNHTDTLETAAMATLTPQPSFTPMNPMTRVQTDSEMHVHERPQPPRDCHGPMPAIHSMDVDDDTVAVAVGGVSTDTFESEKRSELSLAVSPDRARDRQDLSASELNNISASTSAKLIVCACLPYFYWDSFILNEYKKRRVREIRELNLGPLSKTFKVRILSNIVYFGLLMNLMLFLQCVCVFRLYHHFDDASNNFNSKSDISAVSKSKHAYGIWMNIYYVLHNSWLILTNIALTGILLSILQVVRSTDEESSYSAQNKKRFTFALLSFCAIFVFCTILFHILSLVFETIYWDIMGGVIRNVLICVLCVILSKAAITVRKAVSLAFGRVSESINNSEQQIQQHQRITLVLIVLFIAAILLSLLVLFAAYQYILQLITRQDTHLSIAQQPIPSTALSDLAWFFVKAMSSFIILYYAVINVKQRRKMMVKIINEKSVIFKEKKKQRAKNDNKSSRMDFLQNINSNNVNVYL